MRGLQVLILILILNSSAFSQCQWLRLTNNRVYLTNQIIDPSSITITSGTLFEYDVNSGILIVNETQLDSICVQYDTLNVDLAKPIEHKNIHAYKSGAYGLESLRSEQVSVPEQRDELFETEGIAKSGNLTRGISFGNQQNVFVNSTLNLQMEGRLTDSLSIRAVITDQNVPFQPEGNTQYIQEFDRMYVQLYNQRNNFIVGDIALKNRESKYLRYYKNVQGGQFVSQYTPFSGSQAESYGGVSVAKGKFASVSIAPLEGVSGPYKVPGPSGEVHLIILSNSEKVFLDGKLLKRGFNYDYMIDYNQGEITFTQNVLITQYSRIRVDFEYSDFNYNRTILNAGHKQSIGKLDFSVDLYREKDNEHKPILQDLSNADKTALSLIGDSLQLASLTFVTPEPYSTEKILYVQKDTVDDQGAAVVIFYYDNDPSLVYFNVKFSAVSAGTGDYTLSEQTVNGKVYQWVSPVNGVSQGDYASISRVITPNKKQMGTVALRYRIDKEQELYSELALSDHDNNLYSPLDDEDNEGMALIVGYRMREKDVKQLASYKVSADVNYEILNNKFESIDRYKSIEYARDWSELGDDDLANDQLINMSVGLRKDANNRAEVNYSRRVKGIAVDGFQNKALLRKQLGSLYFLSDYFLLESKSYGQKSDWLRFSGEAYWRTKYVVPGYRYRVDRNTLSIADSIVGTAMNYEEHRFYLRSQDTLKRFFTIDYHLREDRLPVDGLMIHRTSAQTANAMFETKSLNQNLKFKMTYRVLEHHLTQDTEETLMGRFDWQFALFDKHIRSEMIYTASSGNELKRDYVYLMVPTGEGTHTWRDDNDDDIQDLSEFYEAINTDEKNYIRIFVPSSDYVPAFGNTFNYRLDMRMPKQWQRTAGLKKFVGGFSNNTYWQLEKKVTDNDLSKRFNPFDGDIDHVMLLTIREMFNSTFFFNRANPKHGFDFGLKRLDRKQLLVNGFESNALERYFVNARVNFKRILTAQLHYEIKEKKVASDYLEGRNYLIKEENIEPELIWKPVQNFRISTMYALSMRDNLINERQHANINRVNIELYWTKLASRSIKSGFKLIAIDYQGEENNAVSYAMLDALKPGRNYTWNLNYQQKLLNGLQINVIYEGRKSPESPVVNIGRVQVSAIF